MEKTKVYIIGGGVAGMTVAHELCKKKINGQKVFDITILEKDPRYIGGKARSIYHRESEFNTSNHNYLPGEHGFRFFPGFYCNIYRTFKEIKTENNKNVFQNLVQTSTYMFSFDKNDTRHEKPIEVLNKTIEWDYFGSIFKILKSFRGSNLDINDSGKNNFALALYRMITSNIQRKTEEYERTSWKDFIDADNLTFGSDYSKFFADGLTRSLAAAKSHKTSTRTGSLVFPKMMFEVIAPYGKAGKILNAPTNEAWLNYWERHLHNEGVEYRKDVVCTKINAEQKVFRNNEFNIDNYTVSIITAITVIENGIEKILDNAGPDFNETVFIFAIPVEKMSVLIKASDYKIPTVAANFRVVNLAAADTTLKYITDMENSVDWMCGIVFYLKNKLEFTEGHINLVDSRWAITGLYQDQFWSPNFAPEKFGGILTATGENIDVKGILSFIMSNCDADGNGNDCRTVAEMIREDVIAEAWAQIKNSRIVRETDVNGTITYRCLTDDDIYIDYNNLENHIFLDKSLTPIDTIIAKNKLDRYIEGVPRATFQLAYDEYKRIRNDTNNPINYLLNPHTGLRMRAQKEKVEILENDMKLLINSVNTFQCRPASYTNIKNMFLAGDYVRTDVDLATMEGANESGKRAANAVVSTLRNSFFYNENGKFDRLKYSKIVKYRNPFIRFMRSGLFISIAAVVFFSILFFVNILVNNPTIGFFELLFGNININNIIPDFTAPLSWRFVFNMLQFASQIAITIIFIIALIKHILTRPHPLILLASIVLATLLVACAWLHPFLFSAIMLLSTFFVLSAYLAMRLVLFTDGFRYRKGRDWQINMLFPHRLLRRIINRLFPNP